jgi:ComF family protein
MAFLTALPALASAAVKTAMDSLFPPRCFSCHDLTEKTSGLCANCWNGITFISTPFCTRCGSPFPYNIGSSLECMPCMASPPPYDMARAVFAYDEGSRKLITGYKYQDRTQATPMFTSWLIRVGAELLAQTDIILPVPLHRWRLLQRRYNQSALLARNLSQASGKIMLPSALIRTRNTPQQAGLNRAQRLLNVKDAFNVPPAYRTQIKDKKILLLDDVLTTGATLNSCTQALLEAGVKAVYVLTLARTANEEL